MASRVQCKKKKRKKFLPAKFQKIKANFASQISIESGVQNSSTIPSCTFRCLFKRSAVWWLANISKLPSLSPSLSLYSLQVASLSLRSYFAGIRICPRILFCLTFSCFSLNMNFICRLSPHGREWLTKIFTRLSSDYPRLRPLPFHSVIPLSLSLSLPLFVLVLVHAKRDSTLAFPNSRSSSSRFRVSPGDARERKKMAKGGDNSAIVPA